MTPLSSTLAGGCAHAEQQRGGIKPDSVYAREISCGQRPERFNDQKARTIPPKAASAASNTSSNATSIAMPVLLAPNARLIAKSVLRRWSRIDSKLAVLAHAINNTSKVTANRAIRIWRTSPTNSLINGR